MKGYWRNIKTATETLKTGLKVTAQHMLDARSQRTPIVPAAENYFEKQNAIFTVQYPKEKLPVPEHGRYKLHNEIEDCIVCDKCAKICPVDCIEIEPIRSVDEIGKTSDGTPKRIYAAKFDIDMAKCCFCGLCTTVCPTECLTMTDEYDFSAFDFTEHNVPFANMTPLEILEKKKELEEYTKQKEAAKAISKEEIVPKEKSAVQAKPTIGGAKPVFRPKVPGAKPKTVGESERTENEVKEESKSETSKPRPVFRPKIQPKRKPGNSVEEKAEAPKKPARPVMKQKIKPKDTDSDQAE